MVMISIKAIFKMDQERDLEFMNGKKVINTLDNGKIIYMKDMEFIIIQIQKYMRVNGNKEKSQEKEFNIILVVIVDNVII